MKAKEMIRWEMLRGHNQYLLLEEAILLLRELEQESLPQRQCWNCVERLF